MRYPVLRIAHRGASGLYPENTLLAYRCAVESGVEFLEVDVQLTRDGVLVIMHDATLDRTTNGKGYVGDATLSQIRELDAGQGEHVPTLTEVFDLARDNDIRLCIEVKGVDGAASIEITDKVVAAIQDAMCISRSVVTSFFPGALLRAKALEPRLSTLLDPSPQDGTLTPAEICEQTLAAQANIISFDYEFVTPDVARAAWLDGLALYPWAPNTTAAIRSMLDLYVPGIMTDRPDILNEVLHELAV